MKSRLTRKTLSLLLCFLLAAGGMCACGKGDSMPEDGIESPAAAAAAAGTAEGSDMPPMAEAAPETQNVPSSPYPKLTDYSWILTGSEGVGFLTFDGGNACLNLLIGGVTKTVSGPAEVTEKILTVGGEKIGWAAVASFCKLTVDGVGYSFVKADSADAARGPYALVTGSWEGEGASLSFNGGTASLSAEGVGSWTGIWELTADGHLIIHEDSRGEAGVNLALGSKVTASSQETADFPGLLAADGKLETRWSSEYVDPSWLLLDLGSEKKVGAAVLYFETAASADFTFEVSSDGKNYTEAASVRGNTAAGVGEPVTVLFPEPVPCRYVRFNGLARATSWGHSIYELELYAFIPGEVECQLSFEGDHVKLKLNGTTYSLAKKG